jgi:hypothetical protein
MKTQNDNSIDDHRGIVESNKFARKNVKSIRYAESIDLSILQNSKFAFCFLHLKNFIAYCIERVRNPLPQTMDVSTKCIIILCYTESLLTIFLALASVNR